MIPVFLSRHGRPMSCVSSRRRCNLLEQPYPVCEARMLKRFGMNTLALFVVGFGSASSCHVHAQATEPSGVTDLTRVLMGLEEESYRARLSKDTKFWDTFLSENFVSWDSSGRIGTTFSVNSRLVDGSELAVAPNALFSDDSELVLDGPLQRDPDERRRCIVGADGQHTDNARQGAGTRGTFCLACGTACDGSHTPDTRPSRSGPGAAIVGDQMYAPVPEAGTAEAGLTRQFFYHARQPDATKLS